MSVINGTGYISLEIQGVIFSYSSAHPVGLSPESARDILIVMKYQKHRLS